MNRSRKAGTNRKGDTMTPPMAAAEVRMHRGRPVLVVNGKPLALPAYSPVAGRRPELFRQQSARFFPHKLDLYLITPPCGVLPPEAEAEWCPPPLLARGRDHRRAAAAAGP